MFRQRDKRGKAPLLPFYATRDEAIAIGSLINSYYRHLATVEQKTPEQQYLATHLTTFYNRMSEGMLNDDL